MANKAAFGRRLRRVFDWVDLTVVWLGLIAVGALLVAPTVADAGRLFMQTGPASGEMVRLDSSALPSLPVYLVLAIIALEAYQWFDVRRPVHETLVVRGRLYSWTFYLALILILLTFGTYGNPDFLYFQF